ncbi:hypothetical protein JMJ55_01210 [Belnapia sp. T6]|uniref:Animal haem peroxidase n=1 Tax=Belnapia mucosa TaxID=2804532 RepID=A0ABS1UWY9_9PROT|nr:hypothetical protein [Belnapia mucosa]MBL6453920.1 hypothetical protein [Belnapia mucosa]
MTGAAQCPFGAGITGPLPGFRHLFGSPEPNERFAVDGADPRSSREALAVLRRRMRGLATLMNERPEGAAENPGIPSGYTYLLQLMAHDLVSTTMAFWAAEGPAPGVANALGAPLRLRTLYGDGPGACPFAFAPDDARDQYRSRFRFSAVGGDAPKTAAQYRDIGRAATPGVSASRGGRGEALIADSRNDQSALLSQVTGLFQMLHNAVLEMIPAPGTLPAKPLREATAARFALAREAVTLVFRTLLRDDLLPRLLDPAVRNAYAAAGGPLLEPRPEPGMPLEATHGALRFAHAMPRDRYQIGGFTDATLADLLRQSSTRSPNAMPLTAKWILRWSQFFPLPGQPAPNLSMRLGPQHSAMLLGDGLFDPIEEGDPAGLAFRDLMSAGLCGLRSVASLASRVVQAAPQLAARSPMLRDRAAREAALADWLGRDAETSLLTPADVAALAANPPLPFYVLFEAEREADGRHLGILGSLLLAETVHGALARERLASEVAGESLAQALNRACAFWRPGWHFPDPPAVHDMAGLVTWLARRLHLGAADPAFL